MGLGRDGRLGGAAVGGLGVRRDGVRRNAGHQLGGADRQLAGSSSLRPRLLLCGGAGVAARSCEGRREIDSSRVGGLGSLLPWPSLLG